MDDHSPRMRRLLPDHRSVGVKRVRFDTAPSAPTAVHDHATVALLLAGEATIRINGDYAMRPGDFFAISQGLPHRLVRANNAEFYGLSICVSCYAGLLDGEVSSAIDTIAASRTPVRRLAMDARPSLAQRFSDLERELGRSRPSELAVAGHLALIASELARSENAYGVGESKGTSSLVARALSHIERYAFEDLTLEDVARAAQCSAAHITTVLREQTGGTFVDWLTRSRMAEVRRRLIHTEDTIESIAASVGYSSTSHFHRVFKDVHQTTPAVWRRAHKDR